MQTLIIDDSHVVRGFLSKLMTSLGFKILQAENGRVAVETMQECGDQIDLILVDWEMPETNSLEFIQAIRTREKLGDKKLVLVATESEPNRMVRTLITGIKESAMKPFTKDILIKKLKRMGGSVSRSAGANTGVVFERSTSKASKVSGQSGQITRLEVSCCS